MNDIQATLRAALTLYASHIADMQRSVDTRTADRAFSVDEVLLARSHVEGMRKDLAEAFAYVHAMQLPPRTNGGGDSQGNCVVHDLPPGFQNWLVYYIAKQRREALYGGAAAELSRAAISEDLTNEMQRAGWIK